MLRYDYKTTPYAHQKDVLEKSWNSEYWGLFMEMGTGKTKVAIDNMAALYLAGKLKAALILAPKGVYDNWAKEKSLPTCPTSSSAASCAGNQKTAKPTSKNSPP